MVLELRYLTQVEGLRSLRDKAGIGVMECIFCLFGPEEYKPIVECFILRMVKGAR